MPDSTRGRPSSGYDLRKVFAETPLAQHLVVVGISNLLFGLVAALVLR